MDNVAEAIAKEYHDTYEDFAPNYGHKPHLEMAVPWEDMPSSNRDLMVAVIAELIDRGVIESGESL